MIMSGQRVHWTWSTSDSGIPSKCTSLYLFFAQISHVLRTFTSPGLPLPEYVEGFQGNEIPIDADAVIRLCVERLALSNEIDD